MARLLKHFVINTKALCCEAEKRGCQQAFTDCGGSLLPIQQNNLIIDADYRKHCPTMHVHYMGKEIIIDHEDIFNRFKQSYDFLNEKCFCCMNDSRIIKKVILRSNDGINPE